MRQSLRAQSLTEYLMFIMIVVSAVVVLFPMLRRGSQGFIKTAADQIGNQAEAEQDFSDTGGYLAASRTASSAQSQSAVRQGKLNTKYEYGDRTESFTNTLTNMGFVEE